MDSILLDIPNIKGNSTYEGFKEKIILTSFSHGVALPLSMDPSNSERTAGRAQFSEMTFSKMTDLSTNALYQACAAGTKLGDAKITIGRTENSAFMPLIIYTLTNAMISGISTSGGGGTPSDSFAINYTKIKSEYTQQNPDSTKKGVAPFGWDLEANKAYA